MMPLTLRSSAAVPGARRESFQSMREAAARRAPPVLVGKILYLERLTVTFDGFKALDGLTLYVDPGELRCIIGPNGAGKTTMMDVVTGKTRPDEGSAWFGSNVNLLAMSETEIVRAGVGRKFQKPTVFESHTVEDNILLSLKGDRRARTVLLARTNADEAQRIDEILTIFVPALGADRSPGDGRTVHLHSTDAEGEWLIRFDPDRIDVATGHAKGDAAVRGPAADLLLWLWGRRPLEGLEVFGDPGAADALRAVTTF